MHPELQEALDFHHAIVAEAGKALVGYETEKALANVVLMSEIPTTYDKDEQRQVNAGNLLLRGVPGIGKTFFGVIIAAISDAKFARIQGRADLQPTEVVGFQMINPATGELMTEFGPLASAEVILLDEINRIPLKSQSAFLEGLQDRKITVGKTTYDLPTFSFAIATMNPVELGQGTFPLSEAATDRFAIMVNIGYLPPEEEAKLVHFDYLNAQGQPKFIWPASFPVVRSYVDQLVRGNGMASDRLTSVSVELDRLEKLSGAERKAGLSALATQLHKDAVGAADSQRAHAMAAEVGRLAAAQP